MGRRKIEIQPITRKNGLFKKAYELGVLCSIDVAVIIFEDRPGHELKLHQYCSGDIRDIVQRQLRHTGEKDLKGPSDFSGTAAADADGDDDALEEEEEPPTSTRGKRKAAVAANAKMSMPSDVDREYKPSHRNGPSSAPRTRRNASAAPTSSHFDDTNRQAPPYRRACSFDTSTTHVSAPSRSPSTDGRAPSELYLPDTSHGPPGGRFGRHQDAGLPLQHPYSGQGFDQPYNPLFPTVSHPPPSQGFGAGHPYGARNGYGHQEEYDRAGAYGQHSGMMRPPQQQMGYPHHMKEERFRDERVGAAAGASFDRGRQRTDMFAVFLEADERSRQIEAAQAQAQAQAQREQQHQQNQIPMDLGGLDWPTHAGPARTAPSASVPTAVPRGLMGSPAEGSGGHNTESWFDLFTGTAPGNPFPGTSSNTRAGGDPRSFTSGHGPPVNSRTTSYGGPFPTLEEDIVHILGATSTAGAGSAGAGSAAGRTGPPGPTRSKQTDPTPSHPTERRGSPDISGPLVPNASSTSLAAPPKTGTSDPENKETDNLSDADADADADGDGDVEMEDVPLPATSSHTVAEHSASVPPSDGNPAPAQSGSRGEEEATGSGDSLPVVGASTEDGDAERSGSLSQVHEDGKEIGNGDVGPVGEEKMDSRTEKI
ncbi:hypothetical protein NLJ89_g4992 [Agrocybe chaxingu]|uniref:MADS-box domain-containing protein n=1 Tax=Agrocybe chaxingu TaxID=84603 RepID=A0A9W8MVF1_9AGAR|nr:hypothetical protein NLJ89_g4992 [Agrocybe chaxingu]